MAWNGGVPMILRSAAIVIAMALLGCGGDTNGSGDAGLAIDGGSGSDSGAVADTGVGLDAGEADDAGSDDAGIGEDAAVDGGSAPACAGTECAGYPASFERGCTLGAGGADVNCAAELHQIDCCGTMRAIGINHGVVGTAFCPAEAACRATYPDAACDPGPITTDTGDTTTDTSTIHVRCNIPAGGTVGTCETYVAGPDGAVGSCGP